MRLPAITGEQRDHENARQFHEALYRAFQQGSRVQITVTRSTRARVQARVSSNGRRFWTERGFKVRTQTRNAGILEAWLEEIEPIAPMEQPIRQPQVEADLTWAQPR